MEIDTPETDQAWNEYTNPLYLLCSQGLADHARKMEMQRDDAKRDRDEWKAGAAQYHTSNAWLDFERSKFIAALRVIDAKHPLLPENAAREILWENAIGMAAGGCAAFES